MAENIIFTQNASKETIYKEILPQLEALIKSETDLIANLANVAAVLKSSLNFFWVGFYLLKEDQLVLGPFQGPVACTRIALNKGVCGASFSQAKTIVVEDVDQFPGHIACSSDSKSEIVVPILKDNKPVMVLDIDSNQVADFDQTDQKYLEQLAKIISSSL
ncbi:GAF domain-containing protein [Chondrinema litorale]|uniref:GAF domain-containing protein n=1 Tax=Chondrinema litorale TaxID=2994555 RepID=UPI0025437BDA|nr:GAF domain-containing protein [Chondrinema litorale]UZR95744.1 GAF domain-containing protein [Chondrinema litorale]